MTSWRKTDPLVGLLIIGDPHIEARQPGFRKDDYPNVILDKIQWCLNHATENRLLPTFLGDFFDKPRDNPNWIMGRLIEIMQSSQSIGIFGNHDCQDTALSENDSLDILSKSGCLRLVDRQSPWIGRLNGRPVIVGGSSYRQAIPQEFQLPGQQQMFDDRPLVIWLTHHDISVPGYDGIAKLTPRELPNIDLVINGHIHRPLAPVQKGGTRWLTPGNISRRSRNVANQDRVPSAIQIDVMPPDHPGQPFELSEIPLPHRPFDDVFYEAIQTHDPQTGASMFVEGLAEMKNRKTQGGAGLMVFLEKNLDQFDTAVAQEIRSLARKVVNHA